MSVYRRRGGSGRESGRAEVQPGRRSLGLAAPCQPEPAGSLGPAARLAVPTPPPAYNLRGSEWRHSASTCQSEP